MQTSSAATADAGRRPERCRTATARFDGRFGGRGAAGTITAIDGKTLTLETQDFSGSTGTTKVVTTGDTKFTEMADGEVSDIKVGDNVLVTTDDTTGSANITATNIVDNGDQQAGFFRQRSGDAPDGQAPPNGQGFPEGSGSAERSDARPVGRTAVGSATSATAASAPVRSPRSTARRSRSRPRQGDTVTVATNADTKISVTKSISLHDLKVGDTVSAQGSTNDGTVTADSVRKGDRGGLGGGFPGGGPRGGNGGQFSPPSTSSAD